MALTLEKLLENSTPPSFEPPDYDGPTITMWQAMQIAFYMGDRQNLWIVPVSKGRQPMEVSPYTLCSGTELHRRCYDHKDESGYYLCSKTPQGGFKPVYAVWVPFDRLTNQYTNNLLVYINGQFIPRGRRGTSAPA